MKKLTIYWESSQKLLRKTFNYFSSDFKSVLYKTEEGNIVYQDWEKTTINWGEISQKWQAMYAIKVLAILEWL